MRIIFLIIIPFIMGLILGSVGYQVNTWQYWAWMLPTAIVCVFLNKCLTNK